MRGDELGVVVQCGRWCIEMCAVRGRGGRAEEKTGGVEWQRVDIKGVYVRGFLVCLYRHCVETTKG